MTFESFAEELIVLEPEHGEMPMFDGGTMQEHLEEAPSFTIEISQNEDVRHNDLETEEFVLSAVPGCEDVPEIPEPKVELEVEEKDSKKDEDDNDAKNSKGAKWNWSQHGSEGFVDWIKERFASVPKHNGMDSSGLERAIAYLEKLDNEISKAMRLDVDGELDADKVALIRDKVDDGIARLTERLDKIKKSKKPVKKKKADEENNLIVKEAQKIVGVQGIFITVPLMISRIARTCINGTVSAGKDIEHTYAEQVKKWKLDDREAADVAQLIYDMGYAIRMDRGLRSEDALEVSSEDNFDFAANYSA